jgi:hypothetical protein
LEHLPQPLNTNPAWFSPNGGIADPEWGCDSTGPALSLIIATGLIGRGNWITA